MYQPHWFKARALAGLSLMLAFGTAQAVTTPSAASSQSVARELSDLDLAHRKAEQQCSTVFAVNDCLAAQNASYRQQRRALQAKKNELSTAERSARANEQRETLAKKARDKATEQETRQANSANAAAATKPPTVAGSSPNLSKAGKPSKSAKAGKQAKPQTVKRAKAPKADRPEFAQQLAAKQRSAQATRDAIDKRKAAAARKPPVSPLPLPP